MFSTDTSWKYDFDTEAEWLQDHLFSKIADGRAYTFVMTDTAHPQNGRWYTGVLISLHTQPHLCGDEKLVFIVKVTDAMGEHTNLRLEHHDGPYADSKLVAVI